MLGLGFELLVIIWEQWSSAVVSLFSISRSKKKLARSSGILQAQKTLVAKEKAKWTYKKRKNVQNPNFQQLELKITHSIFCWGQELLTKCSFQEVDQ